MAVAYLALKGPLARAIHEVLTATVGRDAAAYTSVARYLREANCLPSSKGAPSADVHRGVDNADKAHLPLLDQNPFASTRQLSRLTHVPATTIYRRLKESLGFTLRHPRWTPHALSDAQTARRVDLSRQLL
jgi:hypothetical protein